MRPAVRTCTFSPCSVQLGKDFETAEHGSVRILQSLATNSPIQDSSRSTTIVFPRSRCACPLHVFREVPYLPVTINRKTRSPLAFLLRQLEGQFKRLSVSRKRNDSKDLDLIHCKIQKPITTLDFPRVIGTTGSVTSEWSLGESERSTSASSPARRIPPSDGRGHRSVRGRSLVERGFIDRSRRGGMCACEQR